MLHRQALIVVAVVAYLSMGVMSAEQPVSPWEALNPHRVGAEPVKPEPAAYDKNVYDDGSQLTPDEEFLLSTLPKLPFKMEKKQLAVAMKLMKAAVKPVIKSKALREYVAYVDDLLQDFLDDADTQLYLKLILDSLQDLNEGKEAEQLNKITRGLFMDLTGDEATARTINTYWRSSLNSISQPINNYIFDPLRSYFYTPLRKTVYDFAERIGTWMGAGENRRYYLNIQRPQTNSWSESLNSYARQFSGMARQARYGLEFANNLIEAQEEARCASGACSGAVPGPITPV